MTISELYNQLQLLKIPDHQYYLHGLFGSTDDNERMALVLKQGHCEVYFKERGQKMSELYFDTESEACNYMLKKLKEQAITFKAVNTNGLESMTVNERLFVSGLIDYFDQAMKEDKELAEFILKTLKVDDKSISKIIIG